MKVVWLSITMPVVPPVMLLPLPKVTVPPLISMPVVLSMSARPEMETLVVAVVGVGFCSIQRPVSALEMVLVPLKTTETGISP